MLASRFGVMMAPGVMTLTRMFQGPYSVASTLVSATTPFLAAQYAAPPAHGVIAPTELRLMIAPPPQSFMIGPAHFAIRNTLRRVAFRHWSHSSTVISCTGFCSVVVAALL